MAGVGVLSIEIGTPVQEVRIDAMSRKQFRVRVLALNLVEVTRRFVIVPQLKGESRVYHL
jgi:hypothetical protein